MNPVVNESLTPGANEPICPITYELTEIRLGGGPDTRVNFWKIYRDELMLNQRTQYRNEHIRICRNVLTSLRTPQKGVLYFRNKQLIRDPEAVPTEPPSYWNA